MQYFDLNCEEIWIPTLLHTATDITNDQTKMSNIEHLNHQTTRFRLITVYLILYEGCGIKCPHFQSSTKR